jgi:hypothetical protein
VDPAHQLSHRVRPGLNARDQLSQKRPGDGQGAGVGQQAEEIIFRCRAVNHGGEIKIDQPHAVALTAIKPGQQTGQALRWSDPQPGGKSVDRHQNVLRRGVTEGDQGISLLPAGAQEPQLTALGRLQRRQAQKPHHDRQQPGCMAGERIGGPLRCGRPAEQRTLHQNQLLEAAA